MLITSIQELRLASPAHALDSIDGLVGFIDNSEHDFLEDKLGTPLYEALCRWYDQNRVTRSTVADYQTGYWNRLLLLAQRVVAFDALGRAIGMQAISVNNAGINQMVADDYPAPDKNGKTIDLYRETCTKEAHAALNQLLRQLEQWTKKFASDDSSDSSDSQSDSSHSSDDGSSGMSDSSSSSADESSSDTPIVSGEVVRDNPIDEVKGIIALWRHSRYYYLAAALLIPSCETLQSYLNIYDSREKFIQLLPDLQFIQEEIIANAIGDDLLQTVIGFARDGQLPEPAAHYSLFTLHSSLLTEPTLSRLLHRLRKVMVALLVGRTSVLKFTKEQKIQAHDDGVRMLQNVTEYLRSLAPAEPDSSAATTPTGQGDSPSAASACGCASKDRAACWTPPLL